MSDVRRPLYVTKDNKGWKLRRQVPNKPDGLREFAKNEFGRTQWVERPSSGGFKDAFDRQPTFAIMTELEIRKLKAAFAQAGSKRNASNEPGFTFKLSDHEIDQIAIAYFQSLERGVQDAGGYRHGVNNDNREDVIIDLALDHAEADAIATGDETTGLTNPDQDIRTAFHYTALRQLIKYGFLSRDEVEATVEGKARKRGKKSERLTLPPKMRDSPSLQKLSDKLAQANAEIARRRLEANAEHREPSLQVPTLSPGLNTNAHLQPVPTVRVGQLIKAYLEKQSQKVEQSRHYQLLIATRALKEEVGNETPITRINRAICQELADLFVNIPAYASEHYKGMTLREAALAYEAQHGKKCERYTAAKNNLVVLKGIFKFAKSKGWLNSNPAEECEIEAPRKGKVYERKQSGYQPFTADELTTLFNRPLYRGCKDDGNGVNRAGPNVIRRSRYWVPLISLFSGMRMGEILQLEKDDVVVKDGISCFQITDEVLAEYHGLTFDKRLKTDNAMRTIPVHPMLESLGLIDWMQESNHPRLFPDAEAGSDGKLSTRFSKKFATFSKAAGVWEHRKKVFHSFRGNFTDAMREAGVPLELRIAIQGWESVHDIDPKYGTSGYPVKRLYEAISRTRYDGLDLSHLYPENLKCPIVHRPK
ncbi:hypothetical protein ACMA5I_05115 [Paracoccaceae bacterium GXU_MW_L88]